APAVLNEFLGVFRVTHRHRDTVRAPNATLRGNYAIRVGLSSVIIDADKGIFDSARVLEPQHPLAESLIIERADAVLLEVLLPELERRSWYRKTERLDLAGTGARLATGLTHRKAGNQGTFVAEIIAIVEVIDRLVSVIERRF